MHSIVVQISGDAGKLRFRQKAAFPTVLEEHKNNSWQANRIRPS